LALAVFCTTLPWLWSLRVLRTLSPFTVSLSVSLEPVYSLVLAYLLFPTEERTGPRFYLGASLLGGLVLLHAWMKRREPPTPSAEATHERAALDTTSRP
jgi:drug/metabolite transporter (DMT)-like permease